MGLLQNIINQMAAKQPDILAKVTTPNTTGTKLPTADEVRLRNVNNYLLAGSQNTRDRVVSGLQDIPMPLAVGANGKYVTWSPLAGSMTSDTLPEGFVVDEYTPNWKRDPLYIPSTGGGSWAALQNFGSLLDDQFGPYLGGLNFSQLFGSGGVNPFSPGSGYNPFTPTSPAPTSSAPVYGYPGLSNNYGSLARQAEQSLKPQGALSVISSQALNPTQMPGFDVFGNKLS